MTERPGLLFDYDRFPPETDRLTYPAPGAPALGDHVRDLLLRPGIDYGSDKARDYARGIFVPFKVGLPEADIPILQISPEAGMDRARHMAIGRASPPLRDKNVLIVGGGLSFHNRSMPGDPRAAAPSQAFDEWLPGILCTAPISERFAHRAQWDAAPLTRICRPSEVHRLPRMLAAGAAPGEPGRQVLSRKAWGKAISAHQHRTSN